MHYATWRLVAGIALLTAGPLCAQQGYVSLDEPGDVIVYTPPAVASFGPSGLNPDEADVQFFLAPWGSVQTTWENCTEFTPFLTLEQARAEVRRYKGQTSGPKKILVSIAGGIYPMSQPVIFAAEDSGFGGDHMIHYAGASLYDPVNQAWTDNDPLFTGGVPVTGWSQHTMSHGVTVHRALVYSGVTDVRDVWVNNHRMVRARFPNIQRCGVLPQDFPAYNQSPSQCQNLGFLVVKNVEGALSPQSEKIQRITLRLDTNSGAASFPTVADWSQVEVFAHYKYVNPHQRVGSAQLLQNDTVAVLDFPITEWPTPGLTSSSPFHKMNLGALGPFWWDGWQPNPPATFSMRHVEVSGEDNDDPNEPGGAREKPAQAVLTNAPEFLDDHKEWWFDQETGYLYLKLNCGNPDTEGAQVVVPLAEQLLVLDQAAHLLFVDLSFAHTHQPMPLQRDGVTPGYSTVQSGLQWSSEPQFRTFERNNIVKPAVEMLGAFNCTLQRLRVAHTGGGGIVVGTLAYRETDDGDDDPEVYIESHNCMVRTCEVFDIAGHGVYVGDEFTRRDLTWPVQPEPARPTHRQHRHQLEDPELWDHLEGFGGYLSRPRARCAPLPQRDLSRQLVRNQRRHRAAAEVGIGNHGARESHLPPGQPQWSRRMRAGGPFRDAPVGRGDPHHAERHPPRDAENQRRRRSVHAGLPRPLADQLHRQPSLRQPYSRHRDQPLHAARGAAEHRRVLRGGFF
jgi:hypothetical protein